VTQLSEREEMTVAGQSTVTSAGNKQVGNDQVSAADLLNNILLAIEKNRSERQEKERRDEQVRIEKERRDEQVRIEKERRDEQVRMEKE
jgi:hypothetical protein